jgi:23S rRNA (adenine2503-C2)-methyltransferase
MVKSQKKKRLLDLSLAELRDCLKESGWEEFRAVQIFDWIFHKLVFSFNSMSNLPQSLRNFLDDSFVIMSGQEKIRRESQDGAIKILLDYESEKQAETVLIPAGNRMTACLSTQSGCPLKCVFCASGQGEFKGNLSSGEIVEQLLRLQLLASEQTKKVTHLVFMGMGEPLLNYENTLKAVKTIHSPDGFGMASRRMTVSTAGIPQGIIRLASEELQLNLAVSLHCADQKKRESLIPLAKSVDLEKVISAAGEYFQRTGREITLEYLMIPDVNMASEDASKLSVIARRLRANVNLIPYNPTGLLRFQPPSETEIESFYSFLKRSKINAHIRKSKGKDIEAACGQLRNRQNLPVKN